jgi:transcriptional regulator of NAD metabolism
MADQQKLLGNDRRKSILNKLKKASLPITGSDLADFANVSRQVIVQDISLLKAEKEPIVATSQGYLYLNDQPSPFFERIIACSHNADSTEHELNLIVDQGATVKNVIVEHPIYGEITASLLLSSRRDVSRFMGKLKETNAALLSELTEGTHLHTIEADREAILEDVVNVLKQAGYLL